ncbi:MAG: NusG domain II-containing protein [Clostridia bacterium]|nr:NusG domain II-containing protein [Clostridia bacterium]
MNQTNQTTKPTAHGGGRKFRNDLIFVAAILVIIAIGAAALFLLREEGSTVQVEVNGTIIGTYPLSVDREVEIITGDSGEELNLLVIKDGKASVTTATCPDGICAAHKPISREGESIVCLPHKVVITVIGGNGEEPDVIA